MSPSETLLGVTVGSWCIAGLARQLDMFLEEDRGGSFVFSCANPHSLVAAADDRDFRQALNSFDAVVADGIGILIGARLAGVAVRQRITGHDFFDMTMDRLQRRRGRAFFLGSTDAVLGRIRSRAARDYPDVQVVTHSPPFGDWTDAQRSAVVDLINETDADVLWVGMTAPRQEKWVQANRARLAVPVIGCIGAVFDYYAGTVVRAPPLWRALGLEWLYRLVREPRRLWRRTFVSGPVFIAACLRQRFGNRKRLG